MTADAHGDVAALPAGFPAVLVPFVRRPHDSALFLDFDGTLAAIVADPAQARPVEGARELLVELARRLGLVAVVSGRPVSFLVDALGRPPGVHLAGLYGMEEVTATGQVRQDPDAARWAPAVAAATHAAVATVPRGAAVEHKGLVFKFPFNVQKKTYAFWDGDLGAASDAKFVREENLYGTNTYVFVQDIPSREVTSRDVPPGIFGAGGDAMVAAKVMYGNVRTLWVEPNTGVIIKGQEVLDKSLMSNLGTVYTTKGTIGYDEQTVKDNAKHWGSQGRQLGYIHDLLRPVGPVVGVLALLVGLLLLFLGRSSTAKTSPSGRSPGERGEGGVAGLGVGSQQAETRASRRR